MDQSGGHGGGGALWYFEARARDEGLHRRIREAVEVSKEGLSSAGRFGKLPAVPVQNRIIKIQKRNRALVTFDAERICGAILRAAQSIGGFEQDRLPDINGRIFDA